jgi:dihydroorotase-like cyclic amidohydrolase
MSTTIIRNGRVIDPANKRDEVVDLVIVDGRIAEKAEGGGRKAEFSDWISSSFIPPPSSL